MASRNAKREGGDRSKSCRVWKHTMEKKTKQKLHVRRNLKQLPGKGDGGEQALLVREHKISGKTGTQGKSAGTRLKKGRQCALDFKGHGKKGT